MNKGSIDSFETLGLVDGPGIRTAVFLNCCKLRCKFCHNPETWCMREKNYTSEEVCKKVLRSKPYFKRGGGVTFSGGEPLVQYDFLVETCKMLKDEGVHIAIDTAGIGNGDYKEILSTIDMVLLDVKGITKDGYINITQRDYFDEFFNFVKQLNETNVEVWIRQVIVPTVNDSFEYVENLCKFIKENIKNVTRVDFLPYHKMGEEKYKKLDIDYLYKDLPAMDKSKCDELHDYFNKLFFEKDN